jgi:hypothetical protein
MPFMIETSNEVERYEARWAGLIECMSDGLALQEELSNALDLHKLERPKAEERASKPEDRLAQLKAKTDALVARYGNVLGRIATWHARLQEHLNLCQANLDSLPLTAAVNGVFEAISRASRDRMPPKPKVSLEDADSLEARARYLRAVDAVVVESERHPSLVANSIAFLNETLKTFARELTEARFHGQKSNTSAFQPWPPRHPLVGVVATPTKTAQPTSDYAWLVS